MIPLFVVIAAVSVGFVFGAAWGFGRAQHRLAEFYYENPDLAEAVRRAGRRRS